MQNVIEQDAPTFYSDNFVLDDVPLMTALQPLMVVYAMPLFEFDILEDSLDVLSHESEIESCADLAMSDFVVTEADASEARRLLASDQASLNVDVRDHGISED